MTIRQKILLLGLVAIAGMCVALWLQYGSYSRQLLAIEAMARNVRIVAALSQAIHLLQKERGLTAIRSSAANNEAVTLQIARSNEALARLTAEEFDISRIAIELERLRTLAASDPAQSLTVRNGYSAMIQTLVDQIGALTRESNAGVAKDIIAAHSHLVAAKEYLGQTRATVGHWILRGGNGPVAHNSLLRLRSLHEEELRRFRLDAPHDLDSLLDHKFVNHPNVGQMLQTIEHIATTGRLPNLLDVNDWWIAATAGSDALRAVEEHSLAMIEKLAANELERLRYAMHLGVIATLAAGIAVIFLAVSATLTLLRALGRALASIEVIAASQDFHSRIPADSSDEIGRISRSFNYLLDIAERLLKEKDFLATTDPLTGINNRLRFTKALAEEAERKTRTNSPMALVIFDIDHFKQINDTHGHSVGDEVLKALTVLVRGAIRTTDLFARWGGEEFVVLLRDNSCDAAAALAEKLRIKIAEAEFTVVGNISCSFGIAAWEIGDTEASLVSRADKALYEAKRGGRNRVSCEHLALNGCPRISECGECCLVPNS